MQRNRRQPLSIFGAAVMTFMFAALSSGPVSASAIDELMACNAKIGRENAKNMKDIETVISMTTKANMRDVHKTDPIKYCDWRKKNVWPIYLNGIRRMEALAKDDRCFHDWLAVQTYERMVKTYKDDERWLSALCLGIQPY